MIFEMNVGPFMTSFFYCSSWNRNKTFSNFFGLVTKIIGINLLRVQKSKIKIFLLIFTNLKKNKWKIHNENLTFFRGNTQKYAPKKFNWTLLRLKKIVLNSPTVPGMIEEIRFKFLYLFLEQIMQISTIMSRAFFH